MVDDLGLVSHARAFRRSEEVPGGSRCVRLIVIESGSAGLAEHASTAGSEQTLALVQGDEEPALEFAERVVRRIQVLARSRKSVERALLVLGPRYEADLTRARLLIARALITPPTILAGVVPELVLSASRGKRSELQRWLPGLVDVLIGECGSGLVTISVQFGASPQRPREAVAQTAL